MNERPAASLTKAPWRLFWRPLLFGIYRAQQGYRSHCRRARRECERGRSGSPGHSCPKADVRYRAAGLLVDLRPYILATPVQTVSARKPRFLREKVSIEHRGRLVTRRPADKGQDRARGCLQDNRPKTTPNRHAPGASSIEKSGTRQAPFDRFSMPKSMRSGTGLHPGNRSFRGPSCDARHNPETQ